jgi:hypothetical protein
METAFVMIWKRKIENGIAPPQKQGGATIVSRLKISTLFDESITSIGACQIRADFTGRPHGFSHAGSKLDPGDIPPHRNAIHAV